VTVACYLSNDTVLDSGDLLLKQFTVKRIDIGASVTKRVNLKLAKGTTASGKFLIALVNADGAVPDVAPATPRPLRPDPLKPAERRQRST